MGMENPQVIEFQGLRSQPLADESFSRDGCSFAVIPRDGHLMTVFSYALLLQFFLVVGERLLRLTITRLGGTSAVVGGWDTE